MTSGRALAGPAPDVMAEGVSKDPSPLSSSSTPDRSPGRLSGLTGSVNMSGKTLAHPYSRGRGKDGGGAAQDNGPATTGQSPGNTTSPAMTSQKQLNEYREKLARDLERRDLSARGVPSNSTDRNRVSPILEEAVSASSTPLTSATFNSSSTDSNHTVRGGMTPAHVAGTPSYPFPRMASGAFTPSYLHNSFTPQSPSGGFQPAYRSTGMHDNILSDASTPASTFTFNPAGATPHQVNFELPAPNLYDLSLMLAAEPGLDAWWDTVVQIMKDIYKAERVTLAVPADTTDIENVPWGQKATYNEHHEDDLSLGYLARGSSVQESSEFDVSDSSSHLDDLSKIATPMRPGLLSRHSFTSYEDKKERAQNNSPGLSQRPSYLSRSKSYFPSHTYSEEPARNSSPLNKDALDEHDAAEDKRKIPSWEVPLQPDQRTKGKVLPVLQALDFEADPLIDHTGVVRVLERGKVVALTRSYPYLNNDPPSEAPASRTSSSKPASTEAAKRLRQQRRESSSKLSTLLSGSASGRGLSRSKSYAGEKSKTSSSRFEEEPPRPATPKYEEYEQAPPSPWSQSPAPSPAVRPDPLENPFFTDAMVDEDSFNPESAPADYTGLPPQEAIGVDNSWTVLHIPLSHVLLSKPVHPFRLEIDHEPRFRSRNEPAAGRSKPENVEGTTDEYSKRNRQAPIAILSILSPIIPYPSTLRHSLENLAPHMATTFSLCRHYSNLEMEVAGLQRRRPLTAGFGALGVDGRHGLNTPYMVAEEIARQQSIPESMTSPSDYSAVSKSATGSPSGTPGWEQGSISYILDRRQPAVSPAALSQGGEGYFSSRQKSSSRQDVASSASQRSRGSSKDNSPSERRYFKLPNLNPLPNVQDMDESGRGTASHPSDNAAATLASKYLSPKDTQEAAAEPVEESSAERPVNRMEQAQRHHQHSMLHSYGADFASTFQSLPPSSSVTSRPPPTPLAPARSGSVTSAVDMPPPSDRLKGLILDSLPAHVFVALPQTGEIVWVNSRFLSYRGQTVNDLAADPWGSIHPEDLDEYLKAWGHSLRTGEQFSRTVRIKRFDGAYRWFYARAVASKDKRGVIMQFLGSYMDIHDQHIAELKAARQEEIEVSEAKHRLLANLIPQIIFTATEEDGITFANEQWLSYTGQSFDDALGLGFMDYVHPEDLARCRIPIDQLHTPWGRGRENDSKAYQESMPSGNTSFTTAHTSQGTLPHESSLRGVHQALSRSNSSSSGSVYEFPTADLSELARKGVIKVGTDSNGRPSYTTEVRLRSRAGEYRWHLIRCVEIDNIDFGSGASSFFGSATDINDHKLLEAKLKEAMESKGRFLSNMSHEIRTPLIGISGMVSFLQDTILNEEQRDYTNTIQTSANSLIMIINDILDLSKVDAGMMKLKYEWFHTRSLIEDVNELVSTMAIAKRLELNYLVDAEVPLWVKGDKIRVRQVLLNVIGNAIKFTSEGEVFSHCKVSAGKDRDTDENEIMLEFAVLDTGLGFSKEEKELIFKPFSQIDGSSTRQHGGSGLGLVISRQLVELHGGEMTGTAVPGKGSTFTFSARFTLPSAYDHPDVPASPVSTVSAASHLESTETTHVKAIPPLQRSRAADVSSPSATETGSASPAVTSTGSSNPSIQSGRSHITDRSSATSVNTGLARFSEAAKASGQDLTHMKLEMPSGRSSPGRTVTPGTSDQLSPEDFRPPMYSILIICPQVHSREATTKHIETTLPKDVPYQITALATAEEAQGLIGGEDPIKFTHIVINLGSAEAIISLMDQITKWQNIQSTMILILSDSVQRQAVMKLAANTKYEKLLSENLVTFIYKPVKPSRFAVIFDPDKVGDLSVDRNRSTAQRRVDDQKASDQEIQKLIGNKGYKVLLVEDNPINQKVLMKYLKKVGVVVENAMDGAECTDMVLGKPHDYYALILVSLPWLSLVCVY